MGYGGSVAKAGRVLGQSGDNGVDGVIDQDLLALIGSTSKPNDMLWATLSVQETFGTSSGAWIAFEQPKACS